MIGLTQITIISTLSIHLAICLVTQAGTFGNYPAMKEILASCFNPTFGLFEFFSLSFAKICQFNHPQ